MNLKQYLYRLFEEEELESVGGFAIDSFPTKASKKSLIGVAYPDRIVSESSDIETKRIMIDFDGTIHKYSEGWKDGSIYDEPFDNVKEVIDDLRSNDFEVIILTTRVSVSANGEDEVKNQRVMMDDWLNKFQIEVDGITSEKLPALLYVDDKACHFEGKWDSSFLSKIKKRVG